MLPFFKKKIVYISVFVVIGIILVIVLFSKKDNTSYEKEIVSLSTITQIVNETGIIKSSKEVDLSFKHSGKLVSIPVSKGDIVSTGNVLAQLDLKDAQKTVRDAEVSLESAKISLEKFKLQNSNENLNTDLLKAYDDGFTTTSDAFLDLPTIMTGLNDLLGESALSDSTARLSGNIAIDYRDQAETIYYKTKKEFNANRKIFRLLDRNSEKSDIENIINETYDTAKLMADALKSMRNFVDFMAEDSSNSSSYTSFQNTLSTYTSTINEHISSLLLITTDINDYKDLFLTTDLDLQSSELTVRQKENALKDARENLADYTIRAPFDGIITDVSVSSGEFVSAGLPIVSIISKDKHEISVDIAEDDIAFIEVGDEAIITFDAYDNLVLNAKIISVSPNTEIKDGVAIFEVILQLTEDAEQIRAGLSADIDIITEKLDNVITIPARSVIEENGQRFVRLLVDENTYKKQPVILGLRGEDGLVEVKNGLVEDDVIITFIENKELETLTELMQ